MRALMLLCLLTLSAAAVAGSDDTATPESRLEQQLAASRSNVDGMGHWAEARRLWLAVALLGMLLIAMYCWALWRRRRAEQYSERICPDQYGDGDNITLP